MKSEGKCEEYFWIEWQEAFLSDLISEFPQIVVGKYLTNTSFDSGSLSITEEERKQGWKKYNELALSPAIENIWDIPKDQFDEWYIFTSPTIFEDYEVFINYGGFSLQNFLTEVQDRFWKRIKILSPETYLAEGDFLICVTKNEKLFNHISLWQEVKHY